MIAVLSPISGEAVLPAADSEETAIAVQSPVTLVSPTGKRAWGNKKVNIVLGCPNRCRYCYARAAAKRYGRIRDLDEWGTTYFRLGKSKVNKGWKNHGTVRFPTTHDITPEFLEESVTVVRNLLAGGNRVIVCSKPRLDCIERLCREFADNRDRLEFRFTIGAMDDAILRFWEPGAPGFKERFDSLKLAFRKGFQRQREHRANARCPQCLEAVPKTRSLRQRLHQHRDHEQRPANLNPELKRRKPRFAGLRRIRPTIESGPSTRI